VALDRAAEQVIGRPVQIKAEVVAAALDPAAVARARPQAGGSSPARVREHAARVQAELAEAGAWERGRRAAAEAAERRLLELAGRLAADVTGS
jgi:argininosuccinate lyase